MRLTGSSRRPVVAVACVLGASLVAVVASASTPASAVMANRYAATGYAVATYSGAEGGSCDLTAGADTANSRIRKFTEGTRHASVDLDATYRNSLDAYDRVRVRGRLDSRLVLRQRHADLAGFELRVGGHLRVRHTVTTSSCQASAQLTATTDLTFTEHRPGFLHLTSATRRRALVDLTLIDLRTGRVVVTNHYVGGRMHQTSRSWLHPGRYRLIQTQAGLLASDPSADGRASTPRTTRVALTTTLAGDFSPRRRAG